MVTQPVIEEIELPLNSMKAGKIPFPVPDSRSQTRLTRKRNNGMQVIGHEQHDPAMPFEVAVIIGGSRKDCLAHSSAAELVLSPGCAVKREEKETPLCDPMRDVVGQPKPLRILHR